MAVPSCDAFCVSGNGFGEIERSDSPFDPKGVEPSNPPLQPTSGRKIEVG